MAVRIGVYDSGIGGLTTLALLRAKLPGCTWFYLADNARMPFGSKSRAELFEAAHAALGILHANADVAVMGCNTVSVTVRPKDAFTLCPDLDGCDPERTLVLATPRTLSVLDAAKRGFMTADTSELAVLTEIQMSLSYKSRTKPSCAPLKEYLSARLRSLPHPPERVLLGCSHYIYAAKEIRAVTGGEGYSDGNDALTDRVANALPHDLRKANGGGGVRFLFTGADESAKYAWLLAELETHYVPLTLHKAFYLPK